MFTIFPGQRWVRSARCAVEHSALDETHAAAAFPGKFALCPIPARLEVLSPDHGKVRHLERVGLLAASLQSPCHGVAHVEVG